jgi:hypothetical protein
MNNWYENTPCSETLSPAADLPHNLHNRYPQPLVNYGDKGQRVEGNRYRTSRLSLTGINGKSSLSLVAKLLDKPRDVDMLKVARKCRFHLPD